MYPLIRHLESRKHRYYKISADGRKALAALDAEWRVLTDAVNVIKENR